MTDEILERCLAELRGTVIHVRVNTETGSATPVSCAEYDRQLAATLRTIARRTRRRFIRVASCKFDDWGIHPRTLAGACGIASWILVRELRGAGFDAEFCASGDFSTDHCWVESAGYVVDITASQFGLAPVVVRQLQRRGVAWAADVRGATAIRTIDHWENFSQAARDWLEKRWAVEFGVNPQRQK